MNEEEYENHLLVKMDSSNKLWIHFIDTLFKCVYVACSIQNHWYKE